MLAAGSIAPQARTASRRMTALGNRHAHAPHDVARLE
jgi:hypothetical protein